MKTEKRFEGIGVSQGISIGQVQKLQPAHYEPTGVLLAGKDAVALEKKRFRSAIEASLAQLTTLSKGQNLSDAERDILEAHGELVQDPQLVAGVDDLIENQRMNAVDAVLDMVEQIAKLFLSLEDDYLKQRAADIRDIGGRIVTNLQGGNPNGPELQPWSVLVCQELSPSDTIALDLDSVMGFATEIGGEVSHTAILAKAKNIPAVLGCEGLLQQVKNGDQIIIDGAKGIIVLHPTKETIAHFQKEKLAFDQRKAYLNTLKKLAAQTLDGQAMHLRANVSNPEDMVRSLDYGAEGSGLFRTELMFMHSDAFPTEEEQFQCYKEMALAANGLPVTIRTLDIGGDKPLEYFELPKEDNPFLGYRAIRISLDREDLFSTQLRAILRASSFGKLKLMFPMISGLDELLAAKAILEQAKRQLDVDGISYDPDLEVGIMIEVPSAALMADVLAKEVQFFSIGTNDLCQYALAVDRGNPKINSLYDPLHPGVLRMLDLVVKQANAAGIGVSMCGEMAADPKAVLVLMGMGLRDFSMNAVAIPEVKDLIRSHTLEQAADCYHNVMKLNTLEQIKAYLQNQL